MRKIELHERIKYFRKEILDVTQDEFGNKMGVSRDVINNMERGRVNIGEDRIRLMCSVFPINEEWLRTGTGDPTIELTRNQEIAAFMNDVMELPDKSTKKRLIEALAKFNERDWETIGKLLESLTGE